MQNVNLAITIGDYFERTFTLTQPDGTPVDLTGTTIQSDIRKSLTSSTVIESFTCSLVDAVNGKFKITMTPAETALLTPVLGV